MSSRGELLEEIMEDDVIKNDTSHKNEIELTQKEKEFVEKSKSRGNMYNNKGRKSYMAQPNVKEYNKVYYKRAIGGKIYRWENIEELETNVSEYLDLCTRTDVVPTVVGLAGWLHCNRDTIYAHSNDINSPFSDVLKNFINLCHSTIENCAIDGKMHPATYIFIGKNYFGLHDDKNVTIKPGDSSQAPNTTEIVDALQKQLAEENIPNATFTEKD